MSLLLGTHALLWWFTDDPQIVREPTCPQRAVSGSIELASSENGSE
jgi:PIN domain nuclease of toxin-antitoxin system